MTRATTDARTASSGRASTSSRGARVSRYEPSGSGSTSPVISNVLVSEITQTTAVVSWSLDQFATGQVEYGTTTSYGSTTTEETSFDYAAHVQTVSGLTAGTTYHYRVKSTNAAAQTSYSADATFDTTGTSGQYPATTTLALVTINGDTMPGLLSTVTDSTWGTNIRRITSGSYLTGYPKQGPWNCDDSRLLLQTGKRILNATTFADLGSVTTSGKGDYPIWSAITPNRLYGADDGQSSGTGALWVCDTDTFTWSKLTDFTLGTVSGQARVYRHVAIGDYEGNISDTDNLIALICNTAANKTGQWDVIAYDPVANIVRGTLANIGGAPSEAGVARSGNYVYVNGPSDAWGLRVYDSAMSYIRTVVAYRPHLDTGKNAAGEDIIVWCQGVGKSHRFSDGTEVSLFPAGATNSSVSYGHVSMRCRGLDGWAFFADGESAMSGKTGFGQLIAIKTDGSGDVRVYGFQHDQADPPNGIGWCPNSDGTRGIFTSRWGGSTYYSFIAGVGV